MPVPKANQRAVNKYVKNNYDRINVTMPKGKKELIQDHAATVGESVNAYINAAIDDRMEQESPGASIRPSEAPATQDGTGVVYLPSETINAAQQAAEAAGEAIPAFIARAVETQAQRDALSRRMEGGEKHVSKGTAESD